MPRIFDTSSVGTGPLRARVKKRTCTYILLLLPLLPLLPLPLPPWRFPQLQDSWLCAGASSSNTLVVIVVIVVIANFLLPVVVLVVAILITIIRVLVIGYRISNFGDTVGS